MHSSIHRTAPAAMCVLLGAAPAFAGSYTYTTIDYGPGSTGTTVTGVNHAGVVIGAYIGPNGLPSGFTWSAGVFKSFDAVKTPNPSTTPVAINRGGQIIENVVADPNATASAYVRNPDGTQHRLPFPGSASVYAAAINSAGAIAGTVSPANASPVGFVLAGQKVTMLHVPGATISTTDVISDSGVVAGTFTDAMGTGAYTYHNGAYTLFRSPNGLSLTPEAIDPAGLVFGSYLYTSDHGLNAYDVGFTFDGKVFRSFKSAVDINTGVTRAFGTGYYIGNEGATGLNFGYVVQNGRTTKILPPGARMSSIAGGTASGIVVGNYLDSHNVAHGFMAVCSAAQAPCSQ